MHADNKTVVSNGGRIAGSQANGRELGWLTGILTGQLSDRDEKTAQCSEMLSSKMRFQNVPMPCKVGQTCRAEGRIRLCDLHNQPARAWAARLHTTTAIPFSPRDIWLAIPTDGPLGGSRNRLALWVIFF